MGKTTRVPSTKIPQSSHRHRSLFAHLHKSTRPTRSHMPSNLLLSLHIGQPEKSPHAKTRRNPRRQRTSTNRHHNRIRRLRRKTHPRNLRSSLGIPIYPHV